ncbi:MAG: hypothetical protein EOL98_13345 [Negativicutes bacterium]|nr:hypothetical protein [Negativicutes bacterium]
MAIEVYKDQYFDTFKIKDKLEDKAKTNVVGVTIAITLIMGASGVINTIYARFPIPIIKWIAFCLLSAAVMYMIAAGLLAIKVLIKDNKMFNVNIETFASGNQALSEEYNECINLNKLQNIMRNNSVFTSYECIRNSLVCLFLILMLVSVPIINPLNPGSQEPLHNIGSRGQYQFLYSAQAVNFIKSNDIQNLAENLVLDNLNGNNGKAKPDNEIGIADITNRIFIKYSYSGSTVSVLLIEAISSSINP